jgi:hypothetical protein
MSALSATATTATTAAAALPATNAAPIDPALEPASIRNGNQKAKDAYATGVAFEQMLVNELSAQLTATVPGLDGSTGSTSDGLGGTSSAAGDSSGGASGLGAYSSLLPNALTSGLMASGGTGVAMQIARGIDPALEGKL